MFEPAGKPVLIAPSDGAEGASLPPPRRGSGLAHLVSGRPRARPAGCRRSSRMLDAWSVSSCRRPRIGQRRRVEEEGYRPEMPKAASGLKTLAACRIELLIGDEIRGPLRVDPPPAGSDRASTRRRACGKCRQSCSSFPSTNTWQGRLRGGWTAVLPSRGTTRPSADALRWPSGLCEGWGARWNLWSCFRSDALDASAIQAIAPLFASRKSLNRNSSF